MPILCRVAQARVMSHAFSGVVLRPLWRQENLFFKIPNVCSIITRVFAWDLLYFNSDGVEGKGVFRCGLQGYPESPKRIPLY